MFNLQQLETLVLCVECGSFSAAARKLGKAQSAVSTAISNLEIDAGILIFDRSSRIPVLTEQGQHLYTRACALLEHAQSITNMLHSFNSGVEAKLTIAVNYVLLTPNFYKMLGEFSTQFPDTELSLRVTDNDNVALLVASNEADIGFMIWGTTYPAGINVGLVGHLPFSVAVHQSHPLIDENVKGFEQVKRYRQIVLNDKHCHYSNAFSPRVTYVDHLESAIELLRVDDNWLLIPNHVIEKYHDIERLELPDEECDCLIQIDRVIGKEKHIGIALEWLKYQSISCYKS
ncbi:LysR family transcriptional regulator [Vibrio ponticus]|uniref:LysR family transcriptional regulator n=1 Tax=Vibrio ponticus TaxID=265668 RepID=A0A3N3DNJ4_9VIBR|nr:LysR family transcriptional regulator [Vibrio ponticus]ROV56034.1 LysR family transcriptional regulator [Vibrio ponticus]ROV57443.1 LysR family transcriptional regulator [Vibrio ponticus]